MGFTWHIRKQKKSSGDRDEDRSEAADEKAVESQDDEDMVEEEEKLRVVGQTDQDDKEADKKQATPEKKDIEEDDSVILEYILCKSCHLKKQYPREDVLETDEA